MRLKLLLLCVVLLATLLLACGSGKVYEGTVISKYEDKLIVTIELDSGRTYRLVVTREVYDTVSLEQYCSFFTKHELVACSRVWCD